MASLEIAGVLMLTFSFSVQMVQFAFSILLKKRFQGKRILGFNGVVVGVVQPLSDYRPATDLLPDMTLAALVAPDRFAAPHFLSKKCKS